MLNLVEIMAQAIEQRTIGLQSEGRHVVAGHNDSEAFAQAALEAIRSAGYAVVPVEPTEAMWRAMTLEGDSHKATSPDYRLVYRAVIAASERERAMDELIAQPTDEYLTGD